MLQSPPTAREVRRWALTGNLKPISTYKGAAVYDMADVWAAYTEHSKARTESVARALAAGATYKETR